MYRNITFTVYTFKIAGTKKANVSLYVRDFRQI